MSEQLAAEMYAELTEIRALLARLQEEVDRLSRQLDQVISPNEDYKLSSISALGNSGLTDVSERHDHYVAEAIADEHLR